MCSSRAINRAHVFYVRDGLMCMDLFVHIRARYTDTVLSTRPTKTSIDSEHSLLCSLFSLERLFAAKPSVSTFKSASILWNATMPLLYWLLVAWRVLASGSCERSSSSSSACLVCRVVKVLHATNTQVCKAHIPNIVAFAVRPCCSRIPDYCRPNETMMIMTIFIWVETRARDDIEM